MKPRSEAGLDLPDIAGMRAYAEELEKQFSRLQEEGPKLQQRIAAMRMTEKSRDGLIQATVGPRGDLLELDLDPRIYRRPDARALAEAITATVKKAEAKARDEIVGMLSALVPRAQVEAQLSGDVEAVNEVMHKQLHGQG